MKEVPPRGRTSTGRRPLPSGDRTWSASASKEGLLEVHVWEKTALAPVSLVLRWDPSDKTWRRTGPGWGTTKDHRSPREAMGDAAIPQEDKESLLEALANPDGLLVLLLEVMGS